MAYVSKETKATLVAEAKKVLPKGWKATFGVRHHSTMVMTIRKAPASVLEDYLGDKSHDHPHVNHHHLETCWKGETLKTLEALRAALMTGNHDHSDIQSDYFDVGWYVSMNFGQWDKPCEFNG